jgi:hypothetical protein
MPVRSRIRLPREAALAAVLSALVVAALPSSATAGSPREELNRAEDYFLVADFSNALRKATALTRSEEVSGGVRRDAWVLRARCELAQGHRSRSIDSFCQALATDPAWLPDRDLFTSDEIETFEQAREACPEARTSGTTPPSYLPPPASTGTPWYKKKLVWGAVGAAAVAGAVLALGGGGDDGGGQAADLPPLPPPPAR